MSVWEMDCSGKGSVVFRLRNNFLHFWTLAFFFFFSSFFKDKTVLGRTGHICCILSLSVFLLLCLKLGVKIMYFSQL